MNPNINVAPTFQESTLPTLKRKPLHEISQSSLNSQRDPTCNSKRPNTNHTFNVETNTSTYTNNSPQSPNVRDSSDMATNSKGKQKQGFRQCIHHASISLAGPSVQSTAFTPEVNFDDDTDSDYDPFASEGNYQ